MTFSLSSCIREFMCSCVCVSLFSFSVLRVCSALFLVLESFNGVSRKFKGFFSRKFQGSFEEVLCVFQLGFKGVYRKFQGWFKEIKRVFQGSFKRGLRKCQGKVKGFQESFKGVLIEGCFK